MPAPRAFAPGQCASSDAVDHAAPLTPDDFGIPRKSRYYLSEIATHLCPELPGATEEDRRRAAVSTLRTLERICERGDIVGFRLGRLVLITRAELERVFRVNSTLLAA